MRQLTSTLSIPVLILSSRDLEYKGARWCHCCGPIGLPSLFNAWYGPDEIAEIGWAAGACIDSAAGNNRPGDVVHILR